MSNILRNLLLLIAFLSVATATSAQQKLSDSPTDAQTTLVFRLSHETLRDMYVEQEKLDDDHLRDLVCTYENGEEMPELPRGNYMVVTAEKNILVCTEHNVDDLTFAITEGERAYLELSDSLGRPITDAALRVGNRRISYDAALGAYSLKGVKDDEIVEVDNAGVYHYIDISNPKESNKERTYHHRRPFMSKSWWRNVWRKTVSVVTYPIRFARRSGHNEFAVFSKPKYRPGERVKVKAYLTNRTGRPQRKPFDVVLSSYHPRIDTVLTTLQPYRPGMYVYEFDLTDSLGLLLDKSYTVTFRPQKRRHYGWLSKSFIYEDYELGKVVFDASLAEPKKQYSKDDRIKLLLSAVDHNGLPVYDGRVNIVAKPSYERNPMAMVHVANNTFVADTLWMHTVSMADASQRELILPDSLFPAGVSLKVDLFCQYLSADNEQQKKNVSLYRNASDHILDAGFSGNKLRVRELSGGEEVNTDAVLISYDTWGEIISADSVRLPYEGVYPWFVSEYQVVTPATAHSLRVEDLPWEPIGCRLYRDGGDIRLSVDNPQSLPAWYTLLEGKKVAGQGRVGDSLSLSWKAKSKKPYSVQVSYLYAGRSREVERSVQYVAPNITTTVSTPTVVYPGQTAEVEVAVENKRGRPVKGADVTAYAITSAFEDRGVNVPIYGKLKRARQFVQSNMSGDDCEFLWNWNTDLPWDEWKEKLGLDTMEYYKFLYPTPVYMTRESAEDETSISAFVMVDGVPQGIHVLYIDSRPHYFRQANHPRKQTFAVGEGYHFVQIRTYDRTIDIDSLYAKRGTKTIISIDGDIASDVRYPGLATKISVSRHSDGRLSQSEAEMLSQCMISVRDYSHSLEVGKGSMRLPYYLRYGDRIYPLVSSSNPGFSRVRNSFLAGPFPTIASRSGINQRLELFAGDSKVNDFEMEPQYDYWVGQNYLKLKGWQYNVIDRALSRFDQPVDLKERVAVDVEENLPDKIMNLLAGEHGDVTRYGTYYDTRTPHDSNNKGYLELTFGNNTAATPLKPALIMYEAYEDEYLSRQLFFGNTRFLRDIPFGPGRMTVIMTDSTVCKTPVTILRGGRTFLRIDSVECASDSIAFMRAFKLLGSTVSKLMPDPGVSQTHHEALRFYADKIIGGSVTSVVTAPRGMITGIVVDAEGEPIIGASVVVIGTTTGVSTDLEGRFALPLTIQRKIAVSYLGMEPVVYEFEPGWDYEVVLEGSDLNVPDVVVTGMTSMERRLFSGATDRLSGGDSDYADISYALEGQSAGAQIRIRGAASIAANSSPMFVVDGVLMDVNSLKELGIDESTIASMDILHDAGATAIYGARAANGVVVITTQKGRGGDVLPETQQQQDAELLFPDAPMQSMRRNFHDDAFWQPSLRTDHEGKASFEVTYPDDLTSWNAQFITVAGRRKTDSRKMAIRSYKAVTAQLSMPRFAVEGDSINMIGQLTNHLPYTINVVSRSEALGNTVEREVALASSHIDTIKVVVPEGADSLKATYSLIRDNGYSDGEERTQPVVPRGILKTYGEFRVLGDTSTFHFMPDPALGPVTVHVSGTALNTLLDEIETVSIYPYLCNEQASSKLKALLAKKRIFAALGREFNEDKNVNALISRLTDSRNSEQLWGWWRDNATEPWISYQVIEALLDAESEGYAVDMMRKEAICRALLSRLDRAIGGEIPNRTEAARLFGMLRRLGARIDYRGYDDAICGMAVPKDIATSDILLFTRAAMDAGISERPDADSIMKFSTKTIKGSLYWSRDNGSSCWVSPATSDTELTLAAYRILESEDGYENELQSIRNYFFETRRNGRWTNIYQSSRILETILPAMMKDGGDPVSLKLTVNGREITTLPYTAQLAADSEVTVGRSGIEPVFITAYQQAWDSDPKAESNGLTIRTEFIAGGNKLAHLLAGQVTEIKTTVNLNSKEDYVMIEIPIPAGCSYDEKSDRSANEVHREHFRDKVSIFCRSLSKGEHVFTVKLLPRFTGIYSLNPAEAKLMYYPTFFGHNDVRSVAITDAER